MSIETAFVPDRQAPALDDPGQEVRRDVTDLEERPEAGDGPRVLILSASVGTGHLRAAEAIELALRRLSSEAYVRSVDVLKMASAPLRFCYADFYLDLVRYAPDVLAGIYNVMDRPGPLGPDRWYRLRTFFQHANMRAVAALLVNGN